MPYSIPTKSWNLKFLTPAKSQNFCIIENELNPVSEKKKGVTRDVRRNGTGYPPGAANRLSTGLHDLSLVVGWVASKLVMSYVG
jgi:hypothetical protein